MRKIKRKSGERIAEEIFRLRARRFQACCGWCGRTVGEDEAVVSVAARARDGLDLSVVQGKVIEVVLEKAGRVVLGCVGIRVGRQEGWQGPGLHGLQ